MSSLIWRHSVLPEKRQPRPLRLRLHQRYYVFLRQSCPYLYLFVGVSPPRYWAASTLFEKRPRLWYNFSAGEFEIISLADTIDSAIRVSLDSLVDSR